MSMKGDKFLTIAIATYNQEKLIRPCLDSLVIPEILDAIEVFVVDDGGTDRTYAIAKEYEKEYPDTFYAIHKENGNWGSVQNWCLKHATGKYYKFLDADDWLFADGLKILVAYIQEQGERQADILFTRSEIWKEGEKPKLRVFKDFDFEKMDGIFQTDPQVLGNLVTPCDMTYRTGLIQGHIPSLPENTAYTDTLLLIYALALAGSCVVLNQAVYCISAGRDEQSTSMISRRAHIRDAKRVWEESLSFYKNLHDGQKALVRKRVAFNFTNTYLNGMLALPPSEDVYREIEQHIENAGRFAHEILSMGAAFSKDLRNIMDRGQDGYLDACHYDKT